MVLSAILRQDGGAVALVAQAHVVDEIDAAFPVSVEEVGSGGVDVILPSHEVPHEVAPVHPSQLEVEKEIQVAPEGGLAILGTRYAAALSVHIGQIELLVSSVRAGRPHPREEHLAVRMVIRVGGTDHFLVLSVQRSPVFGGLDIIGRAEILAVQQRRGAILLAGQVTHQGEGIVGLILVGRGLDAGPDDDDGENRKAHHNHRQAKQGRIPEDLAGAQGPEQAPETGRQQGQHKEGGAAVVRQAEGIHEEEVEIGRHLREIGDEQENQQSHDHHRYQHDLDALPEGVRLILAFAVVIHEDDGRDGQQVQQVHADGQAHQEGDEHDPAVGIPFVGLVVPAGDGPEHQGGEQGRHGVNLSFNGREPERVGEAVGEGAYGSAAENGQGLSGGVPSVFSLGDEPLREEDNGQV